jgi:hypothetical protein
MLIEHFEEELDLPATPVDSADGGCTKTEMVGQQFNFTLVIFVPYYASVEVLETSVFSGSR